MSNEKYDDLSYYNEEIKNDFINQYAAGTQKIFSRIFKLSSTFEEQFGTDLYNFNRVQLREFLLRLQPKSIYSSEATSRYLNLYIEFSISKGYKKGLNPLDGVIKSWYAQFVSETKTLFTAEEIDKMIRGCANAQDAVIISLIFNGVLGVGLSEIVNLKREHVNEETNQLTLTDNEGKQRVIVVSDNCISLCMAALRESSYEKLNGNASKDIKAPMTNLVQNNFVVKSSITKTENYNQADMNIVHRRLKTIGNSFDENLNPQALLNSGMIFMAKELFLVNGGLGENEYEKIFDRFCVTNPQRVKEFVTVGKIKEIYKL